MIKKLVLFSLLFIPLTSLFSCKEKALIDDKIDSQEELEKAMLFTDVEYLQCDYLDKKQTRRQDEYSPSVYHTKMKGTESDSNKYCEYASDGKYYLYEYVDDKWNKDETYSHDFKTPSVLAGELHFTEILEYTSYDKLMYKNGQYTCTITSEMASMDLVLKFLDNKLTFFSSDTTDGSHEEGSFSYKQYTPELPEVNP